MASWLITICSCITSSILLADARQYTCEVSGNPVTGYICCHECSGCTPDTEPCTSEKRHLLIDRDFSKLCPIIVQNDIYMCCDKNAEAGCKCPRHVKNGCNYKMLYSRSAMDLALDLEGRATRCAVTNYEGVFRCCVVKDGCKCPAGFKACPE